MKLIPYFILFLIISTYSVSAATVIDGDGGNLWNGNVTFDNSMAYNSTGYVYPRPYPDAGLIHYWPVEAGTGATLYDEIGGDDATINGGTWNASGVSGYCIDLDGSDGGIDIGKDYDFDNFSISLYVRFNNFTSPDTYAAPFGNYVEYSGMAISNTRYQYQNRNSSEYNTIDNSSLDLSGWSNLNHLRDNSTGLFSLYVDNSFSGSDTTLGPLYDLNNNFYFGTLGDGTDKRLNGSMDELRIYDVVLDSAGITSVYNIEYYSSVNVTRDYTSYIGVDEELQTIQFNGTAPDATKKYTIRASTDDITYDVIQSNASIYPTLYDISGNGYEYIMLEQNTSDATDVLILHNITGVYGATSAATEADVNITYWNPGSGGLVATYCITNITAGVSSINILLNVTRDTWKYTLTYSNDTEISNQTATSTNESLNFSIPLVEDSYNITESSSGAPDTKFEYWAPGWTENPVDYHFWFNCFWNTSGYPNGVAPNAEQTGSQHSLKITNNGSAAGTANIKFNESSPAEVTVYIDDDYTVAGAMVITNSYQEIGSVLQPGENVTLSTWVKLEGLTSVWEFTVQVEVQ